MRRAGVEILFMCWPWAKMEPVKASILNPTRPPNELHVLPKTFHVSSEHSSSSALPPNLFSSEAAVYAPPMPQHLSAGFLLALQPCQLRWVPQSPPTLQRCRSALNWSLMCQKMRRTQQIYLQQQLSEVGIWDKSWSRQLLEVRL